MKFTILSHASMLVEHAGTSLLTDPWLIGSCYWRSWWNFPEPPPELLEHLKPNYVYITHLHWDHFHGISLRKLIDRQTRILVPKVCTRRMVEDLHVLGFRNVQEIPHGTQVPLGRDFTLRSYQFGMGVDSAAVLQGGGVTLFDANDCKLFGQPLRHLLRRCGRPDFVLRSHSSASAIPYCVAGYEQDFADYRSQQNYVEEFAAFAVSVGATYAIPFASNHCFLHRETMRYNDTAVTPRDVEEYCNRLAEHAGARTRCVVMAPGSRWSDTDGFHLVDFDYCRKNEYVAELSKRRSRTLTKYYAEEAQEVADFASFAQYFTKLLAAVPFVVRRRLSVPFVFRTTDAKGTQRWRVDFRRRSVTVVEGVPEGCIVLDVPARVLNDCTQMRMFSVWTASKRLQVHLPQPRHLKQVELLFSLLDAFELEHLPLRSNLRPRSVGVLARRWREGVEALRLVFKHGVLRRPFRVRELYPLPSRSHGQRYEAAGVGAVSVP